jgi:hypothetical protein
MAKFEPVATANLVAGSAQVFPGAEAGGELRSFFFTAMDVIRGILISNFVEPDATRAKRQWDRASTSLLAVGAQALQIS